LVLLLVWVTGKIWGLASMQEQNLCRAKTGLSGHWGKEFLRNKKKESHFSYA